MGLGSSHEMTSKLWPICPFVKFTHEFTLSNINFNQVVLVTLCSLIHVLKRRSLLERKKSNEVSDLFLWRHFSLKLIETLSLIYILQAWQIFVVSNQFSALLARCLFGSKSEFYVGFIVFKRSLLPDLTPCVMTGNKVTKCLLKPVGVYIEYSSLSFLKGSYLSVLTKAIKIGHQR